MDDEIKPIPKSMEKFFGCARNMVKPSRETVKNVVRKIRKGKLITVDQLRSEIAENCNVQAACPASTLKALEILAAQDKPVCYWRVVKKKGELIVKFPGGFEDHGRRLSDEGWQIDYNKKIPVVIDFEK